ncbi:2-octaprenyl-3-methyl-6-methoxy-1,4-benzoquinol hydroxylase [Stenotrophomonas maltophilia]|uniref:5-demethoxyubiquinol-8 5-hydroxylase UbiM n=1 Tax=Stenotrophomonas chelatiphaga TaxID=517011 RepID=UPI000F4CA085|nr:5-demethoxyubiquinol-8 5-hydroxylase UbiM [Stenotrophomonas chelatiphaga]MCS4232355.1 ubiquinone biosynthesis UbiH/UbiF/VisC/COQ6 family hydroxylase [Stenotrophomonas chelatiphaga]ROQ43778.1 2-octaprenyl-3-methyl-6-methoxy-1,4-benzoquinol hydroxylase [Stenotrophomonas maltophilia]
MHGTDVVVVGAGPAGLCFARSLAGSGLQVTVVEPQSRQALAEAAFDGREIALTHASRQILEQLQLWDRLPAAEVADLREARVLDGRSPFALTFASDHHSGDPLGWLVPNHLIRRAAWDAVQDQPGLELRDGRRVQGVRAVDGGQQVLLDDGSTVQARLVVAADSRFSSTRRMLGIGARLQDFGKTMLVCRMQVERDHHHTAWEWFGYGRTMALLPLNGGLASAVITLPPRQAEALLAMDEDAFGEAVSGFFEHRLGRMQPVATPQAYPLVGVYAERFIAAGAALIGDAAVGMHPVTAHGFNLGLASQQRLARGVIAQQARGGDIADARMLARYQREHRLASRPLYEATNAIARVYTDDRVPARLLRAAGLRIAQGVRPFRRLIADRLTQPVAG